MLKSGILKSHELTHTIPVCTKYGTLTKDVSCEESSYKDDKIRRKKKVVVN